jgi:hemerythrin superfamily protein
VARARVTACRRAAPTDARPDEPRRAPVGIAAARPARMRQTSQIVNVLDLLESQHREVDALLAQLESGRGDRAAAFRSLADKLAAHATVEEKIFYPGVMRANTEDMLHESVEEHLAIKRLLADMLDLDPAADRDTFDAKLSVLKENVSHHAHEEEETKLFPIVRKAMTTDELAALGNEVLAMFEDLIAHEPRRNIPAETDHAAALPSA